ncbi:MAG: hypothetical protein HEQ17_00515 [Limnohabitans sp.]|uniref:hypothetical protein n=1 Tax=Limnohabitans sp. TaxID=1907725 RepID=UPI0025CD7C38|nr:hypothetical protein [Limnohabitans sp.]MCO4087495.1 hypothetical protein [Limnohabitans sp.]
MGWSYAIDKSHNKAAEVNRLVAWQKSDDAVWRLVEHRLVGNHLWMIVKHTGTGEISPALYLIQSGWPHHGWGHKSVSERDEVDMPLSLLALLAPTEDPSEIAWRERVEQHHQEAASTRKRARSIKAGDTFQWNGDRLKVVNAHSDNRHFSVEHEIFKNGEWLYCSTYRAKRSVLAALQPCVIATTAANQPAKPSQEDVGMQDQQLLFA